MQIKRESERERERDGPDRPELAGDAWVEWLKMWEPSGFGADGTPLERRVIEWEEEDGPWIPLGTCVVPEGCIPGVVRLRVRRRWSRPRYEIRQARCCVFFVFFFCSPLPPNP